MTVPFDIVVPAAGAGTRMAVSLSSDSSGDTHPEIPKQYMLLGGVAILERTLTKLFELNPRRICLVVAEQDSHWQSLPSAKRCEITQGGASRAESVQAGLTKLQCAQNDLVLVHDSVRPLVAIDSIHKLIEAAADCDAGAILATPVVDTLKYSEQGSQIDRSADREKYWQAQTPQAFPAGLLSEALRRAAEQALQVTDEASAVEAMGLRPKLVTGSKHNLKITTAEDLSYAEFLLAGQSL